MTTPAHLAVLALCLGSAALAAGPSFADARKGGHFVGGRVVHHLIRNFLRLL